MSAELRENTVIKYNPVNEMRAEMTQSEHLFFLIYLSLIDKNRQEATRAVRFLVDDFVKIMQYTGVISIPYLKKSTDRLLQRIVSVPIPGQKGWDSFQLFKRCRVIKEKDSGKWVIIIDAHDNALPYLFHYKKLFFSYNIQNVLGLRSLTHIRMYELLKQYSNTKNQYRDWNIEDLKKDLWISGAYERFGDFRQEVIIPCQKALEENTDLRFEWEIIERKGKGGRVTRLRFNFYRNKPKYQQMHLAMYQNDDGKAIVDSTVPIPGQIAGQIEMTEYVTTEGDIDIKQPIKADEVVAAVVEVIQYLNVKTGKSYRPTTKRYVNMIKKLLEEGYTVENMKSVIDRKVDEWAEDYKFYKYLQPSTLFGQKFEEYYQNTRLPAPPPPKKSNSFAKGMGWGDTKMDFAALEAELAGKQ